MELVCQNAWKKSLIDWSFCRIYIFCGHEDFILGMCNIWFEIIRTKYRVINTTMLFLDVYLLKF